MKTETRQAKLAALLGLTEVKKQVEAKVANRNRDVAVTEDEIQDFRVAQGLIYYLQAPELFSAKVCKHCSEPFLVSRQYVALCSYTCIKKDLESRGIVWKKGEDFEALALDKEVYHGNEPLWIRNLPMLENALEKLTDSIQLLKLPTPM